MLFGLLLAIIFLIIILIGWIWLISEGDHWHYIRPLLHPRGSNHKQYIEISRRGGRDERDGVVSYVLYGNYQKYSQTLQENVRLIRQQLPSWQTRIYMSDDIPDTYETRFLQDGAEVIRMKSLPGHGLALARFLPGKENLTFASLDADDCFDLDKEISTWFHSDASFSLFIPHQLHVPIMAGLWGARAGTLLDIEELLERYAGDYYGYDEDFLLTEIWPRLKEQGYWQKTHLPEQKIFWGIILSILVLFIATFTTVALNEGQLNVL